jgi:LPS-assembly lipoprotein
VGQFGVLIRVLIMRSAAIVLAALLLSSCGFRPLYATDGGGGTGLSRMALVDVEATDGVTDIVGRAFARRIRGGDEALYDLSVKATEQAERLAVQIDASVTRYNYRLVGDYTVVERSSGKRYVGNVISIASFNVVNSQYSTLFAEEQAREKAAAQLVEDIERDALLKIAADRGKEARAKE